MSMSFRMALLSSPTGGVMVPFARISVPESVTWRVFSPASIFLRFGWGNSRWDMTEEEMTGNAGTAEMEQKKKKKKKE